MATGTLETKYKNLLNKIERRPFKEENAQSLLEKQDARIKGGHDEALKNLYDSSVSFKNDLADLRQRVKGLSSIQQKFNGKVEVRLRI